jgi:amidophosphoribosyltransferase
VRGNTIRNAILPILDRLGPRRIVVASAAPPLCYPDCYGIDMASFEQLVAFQAVVSLLRQTGDTALLEDCATQARADLARPDAEMRNRVQPLYARFPFETLCAEIGRLLKPEGLAAEFAIVFQTCEKLADCIPGHTGDWYFTGNYPTPGGTRVVNRALVNFMEKISDRAY